MDQVFFFFRSTWKSLKLWNPFMFPIRSGTGSFPETSFRWPVMSVRNAICLRKSMFWNFSFICVVSDETNRLRNVGISFLNPDNPQNTLLHSSTSLGYTSYRSKTLVKYSGSRGAGWPAREWCENILSFFLFNVE